MDAATEVRENYDHLLMETYTQYAEEITRRMFENASNIQH